MIVICLRRRPFYITLVFLIILTNDRHLLCGFQYFFSQANENKSLKRNHFLEDKNMFFQIVYRNKKVKTNS